MENIQEDEITRMDFPYTIRSVEGVIHSKIVNEFRGLNEGVVEVGPEKWLMPAAYTDFAETIYNFEARPDDVFVCTYPRSGTTWTQEMIWLISNELDYETAKKKQLLERFPYLELHLHSNDFILNARNVPPEQLEAFKAVMNPKYEMLAKQTTPRLIKTHMPFKLMPRNIKEVGAKVVYVARNPKDVSVSYYHFHKANPSLLYTGEFEAFVQYFQDDLVTGGPYWKHILDGWSHRNDENVHFMFYEDAKFDLENSLKKLATFLEKPLQDEDLPKLVEHLQFKNVKKNPMINFSFNENIPLNQDLVRRGKVGGNPEITEEISKKIDEWTKKNLAGSDLKFPLV